MEFNLYSDRTLTPTEKNRGVENENKSQLLCIYIQDKTLFDKNAFIEFKTDNEESYITERLEISEDGEIVYQLLNGLMQTEYLQFQVIFTDDYNWVWKSVVKQILIQGSINTADKLAKEYPDFISNAQEVLDNVQEISDGIFERVDAVEETVSEYTQRVEQVEQTVEEYTQAEESRVQAENLRVANESQRIANENERVSNEQTRVSNESARQTQETTRQSNETARINAEINRSNEFQNMVNTTVTVHALPISSDPTIEKTGGEGEPYNLDFGIPKGNIYYATFGINLNSGHLIMTYAEGYEGPTFLINDKGHLEVAING